MKSREENEGEKVLETYKKIFENTRAQTDALENNEEGTDQFMKLLEKRGNLLSSLPFNRLDRKNMPADQVTEIITLIRKILRLDIQNNASLTNHVSALKEDTNSFSKNIDMLGKFKAFRSEPPRYFDRKE